MKNTRDDQYELPAVAAAGVGGAALSAAGTKVFHDHENHQEQNTENSAIVPPSAEEARKLEEQAAIEAAAIAAPDTNVENDRELQQQAAMEATMTAAPDAAEASEQPQQIAALEAVTVAAPDTTMSGGRSLGDISQHPDFNSVPATTDVPAQTGSNDASAPLASLAQGSERPTLAAGQNHQSVQSISQLHIPGEYPKTTPEATKSSLPSEIV